MSKNIVFRTPKTPATNFQQKCENCISVLLSSRKMMERGVKRNLQETWLRSTMILFVGQPLSYQSWTDRLPIIEHLRTGFTRWRTSCQPHLSRVPHSSACDKLSVMSSNSGYVILSFDYGNVCLRSVLLVPEMLYNLVAVGQHTDNGIKYMFDCNKAPLAAEKDGFLIRTGTRECESGLYAQHVCIKTNLSTKTLFALSNPPYL